MSDDNRFYNKCSKLVGGVFSQGGELETRLSSTLKSDDSELISLVHPKYGEIQLRLNSDGSVRILADEKFKLEHVNFVGRIIKVEYFGFPED